MNTKEQKTDVEENGDNESAWVLSEATCYYYLFFFNQLFRSIVGRVGCFDPR